MLTTYPSFEAAKVALEKAEFKWNEAAQCFERGQHTIDYVQAYVGPCKGGRFIITRA